MLQMMEPSTRTACSSDRVDELQSKCKLLEKQNKILKIENECLINVIEKNHVNLPSKKEQLLLNEMQMLRDQVQKKEE